MNQTTQGSYIVTADGKLLGYLNHHDPKRVMKFIKAGLKGFSPTAIAKLEAKTVDDDFARVPPADGLVVRVNGKVLRGYETTDRNYVGIKQNATSRDNLWISSEEKAQLLSNNLPDKLARRICRFTLVDGTRGEPPMWSGEELRVCEFSIDDFGLLTGRFAMSTENGKRGFEGNIYGHIESAKGEVTRFDLVATGNYWGQGRFTTGAPDGKFPIALTFRLANGKDPADNVAPQGTKGWLAYYWDS